MEGAQLLAAYVLFEEEEEEEILLHNVKSNENPNPLFHGTARRGVSGYSHPETQRHLLQDKTMFRRFFRVNISQLNTFYR